MKKLCRKKNNQIKEKISIKVKLKTVSRLMFQLENAFSFSYEKYTYMSFAKKKYFIVSALSCI